MIEHISPEIIERYRQRLVEPEEMLSLDEHLATCAVCRRQLRNALALSLSPERLEANVLTAFNEQSEHITNRQQHSYLTQQLDPVDRELMESHLEYCTDCQRQFLEVRNEASVASGHEKPEPVKWYRNLLPSPDSMIGRDWLFSSFALRLTAAMALLFVLVWVMVKWRQMPDWEKEMGGGNSSPTPIREIPLPPPTPHPPPTMLLSLIDGGRQVTLDAGGNLSGFELLSRVEEQAIRNALTSGRVRTPSWLAELESSAGILMSGDNRDPVQTWALSSNSTLLSPFAAVIMEDRPTMRWKALKGAESYVVTINDPAANYREVAMSPKLMTTRWTVTRAVPRGRLYTWQVTAFLNGREVTAPAPEAAEAKFRILTKSQANELARGKQRFAGRHLPLGLLYARLGMVKEAKRELQILAADNPQSRVAQNLRDVLDRRQKLRNAK